MFSMRTITGSVGWAIVVMSAPVIIHYEWLPPFWAGMTTVVLLWAFIKLMCNIRFADEEN